MSHQTPYPPSNLLEIAFHNGEQPSTLTESKQSSKKKSSGTLKAIYKLARVIHIYISMVLLGLLIFFCLTGIFLNHNEWFEKSYQDRSVPLVIKPALQTAIANTKTLNDAPITELQTWMAEHYRLTHLNQVQFDSEMGELIFDYQLPAGYATAYFTTEGDATLEYRQGSWLTVMNDLHKGRHSGVVWSWVIDLSAAFMLLFAIAGLVILIQNKKYRGMGLVLGVAGIALPLVIYWLWVPFIHIDALKP